MPKCYISQAQRDREKIKRTIEKAMIDAGITQTELAEKMRITQQALSYRLKNSLRVTDFMEVCRHVHVDTADLVALFGG